MICFIPILRQIIYMKKILALFFVLIPVTSLTAQTINTGNITATVQNENQQALENATVTLIRSKDSSPVKVAITDNKGMAEFEHVVAGSYLLKATMVNYATQYSALFNVSSNESTVQIPLLLIQKSSEMKEVVVEGKKPFIQKL
jgi:iron complex outermembrane receptor protein